MSAAALLNTGPNTVAGPRKQDMQAALQARNPGAPARTLGPFAQLLALASDVFAKLSEPAQRELLRHEDRFREALEQETLSLARVHLAGVGPTRKVRGTGLGSRVSATEGSARLARYTSTRPMEDWAGRVAGAMEVERTLGIPRSTLASWQQQGAVVGLLRGQRKLAYPLDQFVDSRPLEGVADVLKCAPDARSAWLWMRQPHAVLDGRTPLEALRAGMRADVAMAANRDLGRPLA